MVIKNLLKLENLYLSYYNHKGDIKMKILDKIKEKEKGFVILIAVLLAVIFGLIGASIFSISIKELALSSGGKESQYAFYAADSGMECAFYWDLIQNKFATSTHSAEPSDLYCAGQDITASDEWYWKASIDGNPTNNNQGGTIFSFNLYPNDPSRSDCVIVYVLKTKNANGTFSTKIKSRGYNTCDSTNSRRVERAVEVNY